MVHTFSFDGDIIVVDAGSGSIHITDAVARDAIVRFADNVSRDDIARELLQTHDNLTQSDIDELFADIDALRDAGQLFAPDVTELVPPQSDNVIKALCLHVAHACNLRCDYCFAGQGQYHGEVQLMTADTARRAIDFLIAHSGDRRNLEVDFFGGEPLLNFDVVRETVAYARSLESLHGKLFRFTLTTNGVLLDDAVTDFCNAEIANVVLSLDGRRETNDARRKTPDGGGSYDTIVPKFQRFAERRGDRGYYLRGTYTRENTDFVDDILHMADLGFTELAMEPAVLPRDHKLALQASDMPQLFAQYERLAREMARRDDEGRGFTFYHYMLDLENGPCAVKRARGCGSGSEYFAVAPDGTLYPCHQLVGEPQFVSGDVSGGVKSGFTFRRRDLNERAECRDCWAKLWCAGGCAANAYHDAGDVDGVHAFGCELYKKRLECAIWLNTMSINS
ncbi:MAG: thioether cross-link-forming SCIFF peptide maturase [Oscillospiraceae bacterium]|nr:thioether cross-link-forming SCIFF peptide maturase [Oscillospiraceae bacterium]